MKPRLNILFTSAGRRVSLLRAFKRELAALDVAGRVLAADLQTNAPATFVADERFQVPRVDAPDYAEVIAELCQEKEVDLLIPLLDPELPIFARKRALFEAVGTRLLLSSEETTAIGDDKVRTCEFLAEVGIRAPRVFDIDAHLEAEDALYPLILKPRNGSGSAHVSVVRSREELAFFRGRVPNPMLQELLIGDEYTLDIFVDFSGAVRCVVPRRRIEVRAGEVSKGLTTKHAGIMEAGRRLGEALPGARGCITAQCFLSPTGEVSFIEINPRFGGGYPLSYAAGANYVRWICELALGREPEIGFDAWQDGLLMLRYDDEIFVEPGGAIRQESAG